MVNKCPNADGGNCGWWQPGQDCCNCSEVVRLQAMIVEFVKQSQWAADSWKRQDHIAPLFAEAERIGAGEG